MVKRTLSLLLPFVLAACASPWTSSADQDPGKVTVMASYGPTGVPLTCELRAPGSYSNSITVTDCKQVSIQPSEQRISMVQSVLLGLFGLLSVVKP